VNIILKAIINFIKDIIGKMAYNKQMNNLKQQEEKLKENIGKSKEKSKNLKQKLKTSTAPLKDAKDAADYVKDFLKDDKGRK
jgi:peptide methionine sulfoxide reductase MsrA